MVRGETGLLVPVADKDALAGAIRELSADPALRQRMGDAGRRRALDLYDESKVIERQLKRLALTD